MGVGILYGRITFSTVARFSRLFPSGLLSRPLRSRLDSLARLASRGRGVAILYLTVTSRLTLVGQGLQWPRRSRELLSRVVFRGV